MPELYARGRMTASELATIAALMEAKAGVSTTANANEAGYWLRIARAAETLSGTSSVAHTTIDGYMLRAAIALEALAGTSGIDESSSYAGHLKRIVEALESTVDSTTPGILEDRLLPAAWTPSPLSITDFQNSNYRLNGVASTYTAMWQDETGAAIVDPIVPATDFVPGVGLQLIKGPAAFDSAAEATAAHLAVLPLTTTGISGIMEGQIDLLDDNLNFGLWIRNPTYTAYQYVMSISDHNGQLVKDTDGHGVGGQYRKPAGEMGDTNLHKIAFTLSNGHLAISIDGGPVGTEISTMTQSLLNGMTFWVWHLGASGVCTVTVKYIKLYPVVPDALLRHMSKQ